MESDAVGLDAQEAADSLTALVSSATCEPFAQFPAISLADPSSILGDPFEHPALVPIRDEQGRTVSS